MKFKYEYELNAGSRSLKYYKFYTPGIGTYKTKRKVIEALELGIEVYCFDKIMKTTEKWDGENWVKL